jgi:alanine dehydrogenase
MLILNADEIASRVSMPQMIEAVRTAFQGNAWAPKRQVLPLAGGDGRRQLLMMPAFEQSGAGIVKLSTVFPDNPNNARSLIQGALVVFSEHGTPVAVLDGAAVTRLRTAAASACASSYLSREDSSHLLLVGSGALAPHMAQAHCAMRPIRQISVWGRRSGRVTTAVDAIQKLLHGGARVVAANELEPAVASADIVCCATSSAQPLVAGRWLRPGTFVDIVGNFSPTGREVDDEVLRRSRIYVDTFEGALAEAGDILEPLSRGVISRQAILGELSDLVRGRIHGRRSADEITLFKSVGTALEDLAAAQLIVAGVTQR